MLLLGQPWFSEDFRALGHDVRIVTLGKGSDVPLDHIPTSIHAVLQSLRGWLPDCILLNDDSSYPVFLGLESLDIPLVWYAVDTHLHRHWHRAYASLFDVVLVAQHDYMAEYRRDSRRQHVQWLPLFCPATKDFDRRGVRNVALSFVGTLNSRLNRDRVTLIGALCERVPLVAQSGAYRDLFNRSLMVLNQCVANDVNFRTFETMACGALLLMERVGNGLDRLFQDRTHFVLYERGNVEQIVDLVRYYLDHAREREAIASCGHDEVTGKHSSRHRAETIVGLLRQLDVQGMVMERKRNLMALQACLATVYDQAAEAYREAVDLRQGPSALVKERNAVAMRYGYVASVIKQELDMNLRQVPA